MGRGGVSESGIGLVVGAAAGALLGVAFSEVCIYSEYHAGQNYVQAMKLI